MPRYFGTHKFNDLRAGDQSVQNALDGYAQNSTVSEHYTQHSAAIQTILKDLDGYLTTATGVIATQAFDGYVAFFTGSTAIAGDNDLYWDRVTNQLQVGGGGLISANANGPMLSNSTSSATSPTLIPDRVSTTAGIGGTGGDVSIITGGLERINIDTSTGKATFITGWISNGGARLDDGNGTFAGGTLVFGTGSDASIMYSTTQTPDSWMFGVSSDSRALVVYDQADSTTDFAHTLQINPTVFIQSSDATNINQWLSFAHNQDDGYIQTGYGSIRLSPTSNLVKVDGYVIPTDDDAYGLGDEDHRWKNLFLAPESLHIRQNASENDTGVERDWNIGINSTGHLTIRQSENNMFRLSDNGSVFLGAGNDSTTLTLNWTSGNTFTIQRQVGSVQSSNIIDGAGTYGGIGITTGLGVGTLRGIWVNSVLVGSNFGSSQSANYSGNITFGMSSTIKWTNTSFTSGTLDLSLNKNAAGLLNINGSSTTSRYLILGHNSVDGYIGNETGNLRLNSNRSIILEPLDGYVVPFVDDGYSLGSQSKRWKDLWLGPGSLHIRANANQTDTGIERDWNIGIDSSGDMIFRQSIDCAVKFTSDSYGLGFYSGTNSNAFFESKLNSILNLETAPIRVGYNNRFYPPSVGFATETAAIYHRMDHSAGQFTYWLYGEVDYAQSLTGGSVSKVIHRGKGDAHYVALMRSSTPDAGGFGYEAAMFTNGSNGFIATLQGNLGFSDSEPDQSNCVGFQALWGDDGVDPGFTPNYGMFFANNSPGHAFMARLNQFADSGVPQIMVTESNYRIRNAIYGSGSTHLYGDAATAGSVNKVSPDLVLRGHFWDGENLISIGRQTVLKTVVTAASGNPQLYCYFGDIGIETLGVIIDAYGIDFQNNDITNVTNIQFPAAGTGQIDLQGGDMIGVQLLQFKSDNSGQLDLQGGTAIGFASITMKAGGGNLDLQGGDITNLDDITCSVGGGSVVDLQDGTIVSASLVRLSNDGYLSSITGDIFINPEQNVQVDGYIIPTLDNTYSLGRNTQRWKELWLGPGSLHIGANANQTDTGVERDWNIGINSAGDMVFKQSNDQWLKFSRNTQGERQVVVPDGVIQAFNNFRPGVSFVSEPGSGIAYALSGTSRITALTSNNVPLIECTTSTVGGASTISLGGGTGVTISALDSGTWGLSSGGMTWGGSSIKAWLTQNQTGSTVNDVRLIGSADAAGEYAVRVGTRFSAAEGGNNATLLQIGLDIDNAGAEVPVAEFYGSGKLSLFNSNKTITLRHTGKDGYLQTDFGPIVLAPQDGYIYPMTDDAYSLGSASVRWRDIWLGPNTLHIYQKPSENELGLERDWQMGINSVGDLFIRQSNDIFIAVSSEGGSLVIGLGARAFSGSSNTAIGTLSSANNVNGVGTAIGYNASVAAGSCTAIGANASVTGSGSHFSTVIGTSATSASTTTVVIGYNASIGAGFGSTIAIGPSASISGANGIAIGPSAGASASAINLGTSGAVGTQSIGIGVGGANGATDSITLGYQAQNAPDQSIAIGATSLCSGVGNTGSIALGYGADTNGPGAIAIGWESQARGKSIALGYQATTSTFTNALAIGENATATTNNEGQIGTAAIPIDIKTYGDLTLSGNISVGGNIVNDDLSETIQVIRQSLDGYVPTTGASQSLKINSFNIATEPSEYLQLAHNSIDGYISTGRGNILLESADGYVATHGQIFSFLSTTHHRSENTITIDWNQGNSQVVNLGLNTGTVTLSYTNARAGASYILKIIQHASAPQNITWPGGTKWPDGITPVISTGANAIDIVSIFYDGESYYSNIGQNYS